MLSSYNDTSQISPVLLPMCFLGLPTNHHGYRCLDFLTRKIILSRHVFFDETTFPFKSVTPNEPPSYTFLDDIIPPLPYLRTPFPPIDPMPPPSPTTQSPNPAHSLPSATPSPMVPNETVHPHPMTTHLKNGIVKPIQHLNLHTSSVSPVPRSHLQAMQDPNWTKAMNDEFNALMTM